jgi:hypothetical protein
MRRRFVSLRAFSSFLVIVTVAMTAPSSAFAQPHPKADKDKDKGEAARLKKEGDALMDQDKYADALAVYARSFELSGDPALLYNQARALEAMGDYPDALDKLEQFEKDASPTLRAKVPGLRELMADVRGRIATLVVSTNANGARLLVREKAVGTIQNQHRLRTRAGPATVEVVAEGYIPFKKEVDLPAGTVVSIDAILVPKKRPDAILIVRTRPSADITMDGSALGRSPLEARVSPGSHELVATAEGHEEEKVRMTLAMGDRREVDLELKKPPGIFSKWYFWTGVVAVVAGGVALGIALNTEKSPTVGTFGSGQTTGP